MYRGLQEWSEQQKSDWILGDRKKKESGNTESEKKGKSFRVRAIRKGGGT